ncbi:MAG: bifunctional (p)ppGpp synthetase/guanosine-3',5'-bis(diphosphate) 3'-pyrophosphohydrolase [Planctomycetes bacterium]|nr:bifunctional (p)ppGpp synthetase/guanosine-3',5'-bis(diphosphate) 3'-pyrophosphohydrolase [Planctomycetota bacterium]
MYSQLLERALHAAIAAHDGQTRKGDASSPYVTHPLHVALMLARFGLEEDVIAAGLLHDVVEDSPGWTVERVAEEFNPHVAGIVSQLTEDKTRSWGERKSAGVAKVPHMSPEAASVKACDKLHNLHSLTAQLRSARDPDQVWSQFNGGRERTLAMSHELVEALAQRVDARIARALRAALAHLLELSAPAAARP